MSSESHPFLSTLIFHFSFLQSNVIHSNPELSCMTSLNLQSYSSSGWSK